jgi:hypothetical protein
VGLYNNETHEQLDMLYQHRNSSLHGPYNQHRICSWLVIPDSLSHQHSKPCSQQHSKSRLQVPSLSDKGPVYQYSNHQTGDMSGHSNILNGDSIRHRYLPNSMLCTRQLHMSRQPDTLCLYPNNMCQGHDSENDMSRSVDCQSSPLLCSNSHTQLQYTNQVHRFL